MKNIFIVGVPRSGKTTLSKIIKLKYPKFNIISFEAIRNGYIKTQPDLNMENRNSISRKEILPQFIIEFVHWNNDIYNFGNIVEGDFADIETIVNNITDQDIVICLGFNGRKIDDVVNRIKENDTKEDYTSNWTKEHIKKHFYDITQKDIDNFELCKKYGIEYFDTFNNREEVFQNILKYLEKNL